MGESTLEQTWKCLFFPVYLTLHFLICTYTYILTLLWMIKKELGLKNGTGTMLKETCECFSQNRKKKSFEYDVRLRALMQITENPAT